MELVHIQAVLGQLETEDDDGHWEAREEAGSTCKG